jgi:DNA end-binding protein Ku
MHRGDQAEGVLGDHPCNCSRAGYHCVMARTVWKGSLSFGLVNVPVGMYPATEDHTIHFHQFEDGSADRIRLRRVNERTGDEVDLGDIVKGYDLGDGNSVIVTPDELDAIAPKRSKTIEITDFVELEDIDPIYFQSSYYLLPSSDGAVKAYGLLRQAMAKAGKAGIAPFVMRGKEYLAAVRADHEILVVETMHFADEIRSPADLIAELPDLEDADLLTSPNGSSRELKMAKQLIDSLSAPWDPSSYRDTYRADVEALIENKRAGNAVVSESPEDEPAPVIDLMEALRASVSKVKGDGGSRSKSAGSTRAASKKAKAGRPANESSKASASRSTSSKATSSKSTAAKKSGASRRKAS